MGGWYSLEEVYLINGKPKAMIRRGKTDNEWDVSVGEPYSNHPDDHLYETKCFGTKVEAKQWAKSRLIARGYI